MSRIKCIEEQLREGGLKVTPKRVAMYNYICSTKEHPTAETIYKNIKVDYPKISVSTVYRNLKSMVEIGVIKEIYIENNFKRFDADTSDHIHLICNVCKSVKDSSGSINIGKILKKAEKYDDYKIEKEEIILRGICKNCW